MAGKNFIFVPKYVSPCSVPSIRTRLICSPHLTSPPSPMQSERQVDSGGLNGRPEKQADVCYSWWILSSMAMLGHLPWIDNDKLVKFILEYDILARYWFASFPFLLNSNSNRYNIATTFYCFADARIWKRGVYQIGLVICQTYFIHFLGLQVYLY